jgi:hypothetical protein
VDYRSFCKLSAIARPLDPAKSADKAVLAVVVAAAMAGLGSGAGLWSALQNALVFALAAYGSWAVAREMLPDDHAAAWVSMAMGILASLSFHAPGLLVLYATLGLLRVVTRSTGCRARTSDSIILTCLVIGTVYASEGPWFGAVGALAFFLDGVLSQPFRKQWFFALVCLGSMVVYMVDHDVLWWRVFDADSLLEWLAILASILFLLNLVLLKKVHSRGDADHQRLEVERVKAGMVVGVLAALQGLENMPQVILLVACIGGLCIGTTFRRAFRSSAKGLHAG